MNFDPCEYCLELQRDLQALEMELASFTQQRLEMSDATSEEFLEMDRHVRVATLDHQVCLALWRHHRIVHQRRNLLPTDGTPDDVGLGLPE